MHVEITKIALKKGRPTIKGQRCHPSGPVEEFSLDVGEISPELTAEMAKLLDVLCGFCCLAEDWDEGEITGITLKSTENGFGCVVTGQLRVEDDSAYVVVVNSPYLAPERLGEKNSKIVRQIATVAKDLIESLPQQLALEVK